MSEHQPPRIRCASESERDRVRIIVPPYRVDRATKNSTRSSLRRQDRWAPGIWWPPDANDSRDNSVSVLAHTSWGARSIHNTAPGHSGTLDGSDDDNIELLVY